MASVFWTTVGRFLAREKAPVHRTPSWRGRLLRALALLLLALGVFGAYQAPRTEALQVQRVTVQGTDRLNPEDIRATAGLLGVSLWRVRAGEVERRLESIPYVADAVVEAGLSTTVRIRIEERVPRVAWRNDTGTYLVDDKGVVLEDLNARSPLPLLEVADARRLRPGDRVDPRQLLFAIGLYAELPPHLRLAVHKVTYDRARGYQLVSDKGWRAVLGDASRVGVKAEVLRHLLSRGDVAYADVSSPTTPYYRMRRGATKP